MSQEYVKTVKKATTELFSTMMAMDLEVGEIVSDKKEMEKKVVITGNIGLAGDYKGNIAIHFTLGMALKSISAMLGMDFDELTDDTKDAIGEIANIVAGGMKTELSNHGISFDLSLPTVIAGEDYSIFSSDAEKSGIIIPFNYSEETMFVEFDLEKVDN